VGHVARMRQTEMHVQLWYANLKERGHLKELGVGRTIIL